MKVVQPTFSIITPNYNSGDRLAATCASVLGQASGIEHIIVDGESTDGSLALAIELAREHPERIRLISEPDRGIYDAMNKGIQLARGRCLYFLGAGDTMRPDVLAGCMPYLPDHDRGVIYGNVLIRSSIYAGPWRAERFYGANLCHQAILYGRDVFRLCGRYDLKYRLLADHAFNIRCFGRREVKWIYVPITFAIFEGGGATDLGIDEQFIQDKDAMIREHLGLLTWIYGRHGSLSAFLLNLPRAILRRASA